MSSLVRSYLFDREVSDSRMSIVKKTLGLAMFRPATRLEDTEHATDLVPCIKIDQLAVRVRNYNAKNYAGEITMRCGRTATPITELQKIFSGNATHMFYGIMNYNNDSFYWWVLVDLNRFRSIIRENPLLLNEFNIIPNRDGQSSFMVIPLKLISECVVHSSRYLESIVKGYALEAACP